MFSVCAISGKYVLSVSESKMCYQYRNLKQNSNSQQTSLRTVVDTIVKEMSGAPSEAAKMTLINMWIVGIEFLAANAKMTLEDICNM